MRDLRLFFRLSPRDKRFFTEAFILLGIWRALVLLFPFKTIQVYLAGKPKTGEKITPDCQKDVVISIERAVRAVSRRTPWRSTCLVQAIAARLMLRRRGLGSTLYFGVSTRDRLQAHAWLQCGDQILTGGDGHEEYQVISAIS